MEKIGELVKEKIIKGISEIRDETNKEGIKIVIELKRDANASIILNKLYKSIFPIHFTSPHSRNRI